MKKTLFTLFAAVAFVCSMTLISCNKAGSLVEDYENTASELVEAYKSGDEAKIESLTTKLGEIEDQIREKGEEAFSEEEVKRLEAAQDKVEDAEWDFKRAAYEAAQAALNSSFDDEDDWELEGEESDLDEEDAEETGLEGLGAQAKDAVKAAQEKAEDMVKAAQDKAEDMVKAAQEKAEAAVNDAVNKAAQELENLFK